MSRRVPPLLIAIALLIGLRWFLTYPGAKEALPHSEAPSPGLIPTEPMFPRSVSSSSPTPTDHRPSPTPDDSATLRPPMLELGNGPLAWELQLNQIAATQQTAAGKSAAILSLLPKLPTEALATASAQAVEQLPDRDYATVALPVAINPDTTGEALSVLFADLMERPDAIALPALLSIARNPKHPFAEPALDNLRLLLRADLGKDWTKWASVIELRLKGQ